MAESFDIIVVGGGHAGIEAALACARMGLRTCLLSMSLDRLGWMSCNPSIGGLAKSQLVKEIDALGGEMGRLADLSGIQYRVINRGKGPAVWSTRAQCDRRLYAAAANRALENQAGLQVRQETVRGIAVEGGRAAGVLAGDGSVCRARAVIVASGTFLNGLIHIGQRSYPAGRAGEFPSIELSASLRGLGFQTSRLKTGTPARVNGHSVDFSRLQAQPGDENPRPFSFRTQAFRMLDEKRRLRERIWPALRQVSCHLAWTNPETHRLIRDNLERSPLYSGRIKGVGPRYCPSIEDKVVRFADKDRHQVFLEPEGLDTSELYLNGVSSSLPEEVQADFIHSIAGLERALITRPGYAIEYDFIFPTQVYPSLETKEIANLYLAGQINGTSGYEEAAAQGLMAGVNACLKIKGEEPLILGRDQAYIGVLIDDLVTKGTDEPYRMFTSRAEYRLLLREDNARERLADHGRRLGLVSEREWKEYSIQRLQVSSEIERLEGERVRPAEANGVLESLGTAPLSETTTLASLLRRPEVTYNGLLPVDQERPEYPDEVAARVEIEIKYRGYIGRQREEAARRQEMEAMRLPADLDYSSVYGLTAEARQKLSAVRPLSLGQAGRVSGVSPADIGMLLVHLRKSRGI
jgi:tRNA uridine 5-carboxymethylaminomethyl modification enzyme